MGVGIDEADSDESEEGEHPNKLSTGIEILDNPEYFEGGFYKGSVVTIIADPIATAELFMFDLAKTRKTTYFTTGRSEESVEMSLELMGRSGENIEVVDLFSADDVYKTAINALRNVGREENIIFDNFSDVVQHDRYDEILNETYRISHTTDSITYLFMVKESDATLTYDEGRVPYASDVVMKMMTGIEGEKVENRLAVSKMRGQTPPPKTVKLNIGEEIEVDTSRDIA